MHPRPIYLYVLWESPYMAPIDPSRLRLAPRAISAQNAKPPRPGIREHYLRGPIPLEWLCQAASLPGRSLHVGVALWYLAGLTRSRTVPLSNNLGYRFGLDRNSKYRGLDWLEQAGLITVERKLGRAPVVTILRSPDVAADSPSDPMT